MLVALKSIIEFLVKIKNARQKYLVTNQHCSNGVWLYTVLRTATDFSSQEPQKYHPIAWTTF